MRVVPLAEVPSQIVRTALNGQQCTIKVYQKGAGVYLDLSVNEVLVIGGVLCRDRNLIVRDPYLGFVGDLAFFDMEGATDPVYTELGVRWILGYFTPAELATAPIVTPLWVPRATVAIVPTPTPVPTPVPTPTPTPTPPPPTSVLYVAPSGSDSNPGTQARPFATIAAASAAASPGALISVASGNYAGGFTTTAAGTQAAPIHYTSQTYLGARIIGAGTAADAMGWNNSGDNVVVSGFEIDGSGALATSWRFGFYSTGSNVTFQNNSVHDILTDATAFANATSSGNGGAAIEMDAFSGGSNGQVLGNLVYNVGPSASTSTLVHGIYQSETGSVVNNVVYNVVGNGVSLWHGAHAINIVNNTIDNARDGGIAVGSGDSGSSSTTGDYVYVANNIVTNSYGGIFENGTTGLHNAYVNNLLYNDTLGSRQTISLQNGLKDSGTLTSDPKYVGVGNYQLQATSPALDAGTSTNAPAIDFLGISRPQGTAIDLGAYERPVTSVPTPTPTPTPTGAPTTITID